MMCNVCAHSPDMHCISPRQLPGILESVVVPSSRSKKGAWSNRASAFATSLDAVNWRLNLRQKSARHGFLPVSRTLARLTRIYLPKLHVWGLCVCVCPACGIGVCCFCVRLTGFLINAGLWLVWPPPTILVYSITRHFLRASSTIFRIVNLSKDFNWHQSTFNWFSF